MDSRAGTDFQVRSLCVGKAYSIINPQISLQNFRIWQTQIVHMQVSLVSFSMMIHLRIQVHVSSVKDGRDALAQGRAAGLRAAS